MKRIKSEKSKVSGQRKLAILTSRDIKRKIRYFQSFETQC